MHILALHTQKGGTGKTTLAVNLAHAFFKIGINVSIADRDPQGASAAWQAAGKGFPFPVFDDLKTPLRTLADARRKAGDKILIIDAPPSLGGAGGELSGLASLVLIPVRPSLLDLRGAAAASALADSRTKTRKLCVLSQSVARLTMTEATRQGLKGLKLPVAVSEISLRACHAAACARGESIFENRSPDDSEKKARGEVLGLAGEVLAIFKM